MKKLYIVCLWVLGLQSVQAQIITTFAGDPASGSSSDGVPAINAKIWALTGMIIDSADNIYFSDFTQSVVRKINSAGIISTVAGIAGSSGSYTGDGGAATAATLQYPRGIARDRVGNFYIADQNNQAIRKIDTTGVITTVAGNSTSLYNGDGGPATAAGLCFPQWLVFDRWGNMYLTSFRSTIRKIDTAGIITTIAGSSTAPGLYSGDGGPATAAGLYRPTCMCFDALGNLYFSDGGNNVVRKIDLAGIITTVAGNGTSGYAGDGGPATAANLEGPGALTFDSLGNLFISDGNYVLRKVNTAGIISTVAGRAGVSGHFGDYSSPTDALFYRVGQTVFDRAGRLYIGDGGYYIRRIEPGIPALVNTLQKDNELDIYPNPAKGTLNIKLATASNLVPCSIVAADGKVMFAHEVKAVGGKISLDISKLSAGVYTVIVEGDTVMRGKIVVGE